MSTGFGLSPPVTGRPLSGEEPLDEIMHQLEESGLQMDIQELQSESELVYQSLNEINGFNHYDVDGSQYLAASSYHGNNTVDTIRCSPQQQQSYTHEGGSFLADYRNFHENIISPPEYQHYNQQFTEFEAGYCRRQDLNTSGYGNNDSLRSTGSEIYSDSNDSVEVDQSEITQLSGSPDQTTACQQQVSVCYQQHAQYQTHQQPTCRLPNFNELQKSIKLSKRGRPVTYLRGDNSSSSEEIESEEDDMTRTCTTSPGKGRRGAKNVLLWKFLLEMLACSERDSHDYIKWMNKEDGTFRFIDTAEISRKWGQKKKKTDMNFEKLSRGIRHYYRIGLMSREGGTRLVYKFNWDRVPKAYRV